MNVQCAWLWYQKIKKTLGMKSMMIFFSSNSQHRMIKKFLLQFNIFSGLVQNKFFWTNIIFKTNKNICSFNLPSYKRITETFLELLTPWNWALTTWYLSRCVNLYFKKGLKLNYSSPQTTKKVYTTNSQHANERRALLCCEFLCKINSFCSKILFYD